MPGARVFAGPDGICALVEAAEPHLVIGAISGFAGLRPLLVALEAGIDCALANKEPLVAAGRIVMETARQGGARLLPIDSELSAIFQCLRGERVEEVEKVLLTASGGPFARLSEEELMEVTPERALDHPTWKMGRKVTIDSATLANKGFEVFEVHWLFGVDVRQIEVLVHHQSIIHSLVQFRDGSVIAQMAPPDMRMPIAFALFYPERVANDLPRLSLAEVGSLTFAPPDTDHFPCLRLAFDAARAGAAIRRCSTPRMRWRWSASWTATSASRASPSWSSARSPSTRPSRSTAWPTWRRPTRGRGSMCAGWHEAGRALSSSVAEITWAGAVVNRRRIRSYVAPNGEGLPPSCGCSNARRTASRRFTPAAPGV